MQCYLHIGTEKTATTTLQNFLHLNRKRLHDSSFIFTKSSGEINNQGLAVAAFNKQRRDSFTKRYSINTDEKIIEYRKIIINSLKYEINHINSIKPCSKIIFSSEHFQSRLTEIEEIERLKSILEELNLNEIKVIVYLRRPADIANSLYSTAIKVGHQMESPFLPDNPYSNNLCNHKKTLQKFGSVFGSDSLLPRLFTRSDLINGSIIDDFMSTIGLKNDSPFIIPKNSNEGLSETGLKLLRQLNASIPTWINNSPNPSRSNLVYYLEKHFSDSKYIMPRDLYKQYDDYFKESNEWVREKYFKERSSLFTDEIPTKNLKDSNSSSHIEIYKLADFMSDIWNDKQNKIEELTAMLSEKSTDHTKLSK